MSLALTRQTCVHLGSPKNLKRAETSKADLTRAFGLVWLTVASSHTSLREVSLGLSRTPKQMLNLLDSKMDIKRLTILSQMAS